MNLVSMEGPTLFACRRIMKNTAVGAASVNHPFHSPLQIKYSSEITLTCLDLVRFKINQYHISRLDEKHPPQSW